MVVSPNLSSIAVHCPLRYVLLRLLHDMRLRGFLDRETVIFAMKQVLMDDGEAAWLSSSHEFSMSTGSIDGGENTCIDSPIM